VGRHSAPDDDEGDLLVDAPPVPSRPLPRPRHAASDEASEAGEAGGLVTAGGARPDVATASAAATGTEVIEPELVERAPQASPHEVIDAVVVEDESLPVPVARPVSLAKSAPTGVPPAPIEMATEPAAEAPAEPTSAPVKERPTRMDLRLLGQDAALRARAAAALLVPFVLYTVVLAVIGRFGVYLFWIWIPAILAGVLFGAQLDAAVRRSGDQGTGNPSVPES
jgi:hypothetical protein